MKFLKYFALIPALLTQYVFLTLLFALFRNHHILTTIFNESILNMFMFLIIFFLAAFIGTIVTFILSIVFKWDAKTTAFISMMIKLLQIPAYIAMLFMGMIGTFTIFLIALPFVIISINLITIFMTGIIATAACIAGCREKKLKAEEALAFSIGQFFFCADIVICIIVYVKIRKAEKLLNENLAQASLTV